MEGAEELSSLVGVSCRDETVRRAVPRSNTQTVCGYLIKEINSDVVEKGHVSASVLLSVHRLLGRLQQTPQAHALVHVRFRDDDHPAGALILLLVLVLLFRVASWRQTSPPAEPTSDRPVPKASFAGGGQGEGERERREGERQAGEFRCGNVRKFKFSFSCFTTRSSDGDTSRNNVST